MNHTVWKLGTVSHSDQLQNCGNIPEIQVSTYQWSPNLLAGLSKESDLRSAMLTSLYKLITVTIVWWTKKVSCVLQEILLTKTIIYHKEEINLKLFY